MEGGAGPARHAGHCQREGEACGDADHGLRWSGAAQARARRQALSGSGVLPREAKETSGVETGEDDPGVGFGRLGLSAT